MGGGGGGGLGCVMMLGKLSVQGCHTYLDNSRAGAYCACSRCWWKCFGHLFLLVYLISFLFPSLGDGPNID